MTDTLVLKERPQQRFSGGLDNIHPMSLDLRMCFYLFVATIPAETYPIVSNYSISQLLGVIFIFVIGIRGKWILKMPTKPFWFFAIYYTIVLISVQWLNPSYFPYWQKRVGQFGQLLFFFWICTILVSYRELAKGAIAAYSYSLTIFITLAKLHVPGFVSETAMDVYQERATIGDADPNGFAIKSGIALIYFLDKFLQKYEERRGFNWLYFSLITYLSVVIVQTQSRGGQLAVLVGLITYVFTRKFKFNKRKILTLMTLIILGFTIYAYKDPHMARRWKQTIEDGDMSSRERIFPEAVKMIERKPVLGYGLCDHLWVLGAATARDQRDPHNSFFWVLHELGFVGGTWYIVAFIMCGVIAYKKRKGTLDNLPFVYYMIIFLASLSLTMVYLKVTWFVLSLAAAEDQKHH